MKKGFQLSRDYATFNSVHVIYSDGASNVFVYIYVDFYCSDWWLYCLVFFPKVDNLYGASVDGPDLEDLAGVDVPEIQLPRDLTTEELSRAPQRNVPLNEAITVYSSVVEQLQYIFNTVCFLQWIGFWNGFPNI